MPERPHVYSIASGTPFLPTLAGAICSGALYDGITDSAFAFADITVYLPTRRAVQSLRAILSQKLPSSILPKIQPLGDISDLTLLNKDYGGLFDYQKKLAIPPSERLLFLARTIAGWQHALKEANPIVHADDHHLVAGTVGDIFHLALELEKLLDTLKIYGISSENIADISPPDQDKARDLAIKFVQVITHEWQKYLSETKLNDAISAEMETMSALEFALNDISFSPKIILAGSTGSMPATARLAKAVALSQHGRVILPGLDYNADATIFRNKDKDPSYSNHPQYILASFLNLLGIERQDVPQIGEPAKIFYQRQNILSFAMQPAAATATWHENRIDDSNIEIAFEDCAYIEAADELEEAKAIACCIRETVNDQNRTVAVITPDRQLVERLVLILQKWGIHAHDTADQSLAKTTEGIFILSIAEWIADPANPCSILNMLSQIHIQCDYLKIDLKGTIFILDQYIFRSHAPPNSIVEIIKRLKDNAGQGKRTEDLIAYEALDASIWSDAISIMAALEKIAHDCQLLCARHRGNLASRIDAIFHVVQFITSLNSNFTFNNENYDDIIDAIKSFKIEHAHELKLTPIEFAQILPMIMGTRRPKSDIVNNANVNIYGLLESRFMEANRIILSGLNEQTWPPKPQPDIFINRSIRAKLGLPLPERIIGHTAHDFIQNFVKSKDVVISRALKVNGTPTIESRFMQRIHACIGAQHQVWDNMRKRGKKYIRFSHELDAPNNINPSKRPSPIPMPSLLPSRISITDAETLIRNPYAIFARKILRLTEPKPWNSIAEASLRGNIIHDLAAHVAKMAPHQQFNAWVEATNSLFDKYHIPSDIEIFWSPSFKKIGSWLASWNINRQKVCAEIFLERSGSVTLNLTNGASVILSGRADRIERTETGVAIVDFKTGTYPMKKSVESGLSPQLTLEAAMVMEGGFGDGLRHQPIQQLLYVSLKTAGDGCKEIQALDPQPEAIMATATQHLNALRSRLILHLERKIGFTSNRFPLKSQYGLPYDHLARTAEWVRDIGESADD